MKSMKRILVALVIASATAAPSALLANPFIDQDAPTLVVCGSSDSAGAFAKTATGRAVEDLNSKLLDKDGVAVVVGTPLAKIQRPFSASPVTFSSEGNVTLACVTLSKK